MSVREGITTAVFEARTDGGGVVWLSGELDMSETESFVRTATVALEQNDALVLDVSDLTFIDSQGIRAVLAIAEHADGRGILIRGAEGGVRKVLDLTGIDGRAGISLGDA